MIDLSRLSIGTKYSRADLASEWGYRSWQAIARGVVTPRGQHVILLFVTRIKQRSLPQYADHIEGDLLFWEGEDEHKTDARISMAATHGDEIHVFFREIHHAFFEYKGRADLLHWTANTEAPSAFVFQLLNSQSPQDDLARFGGQFAELAPTEREAIAKARIGQGVFRRNVADLWGGCAVSGAQLREVLRASHIKPWRVASNGERLDPHNGLLLLPNYDALFDRGLISFADDGRIMLSKALTAADREQLGVTRTDRLRMVQPQHLPYLRYHRERVFADVTASEEA